MNTKIRRVSNWNLVFGIYLRFGICIFFISLCSMLYAPCAESADTLTTGDWLRMCPIVIQSSEVSGSGNLTNFPVLLTEDSLPTDMFGGANAAQDGGGDIRFSSDRGGDSELCLEVVAFDTTDDEAEIWVKVPTLSGTNDTTIYVWYDNASASAYAIDDTYGAENVWNGNYMMVQHMTGAGYTVLDDSTSNDNDVTASGGDPAYNQAGNIGQAVTYDGTLDYVEVGDSLNLGTNDYTITAWFKRSGTDSMYIISPDQNIIGAANYEFPHIRIQDTTTIWNQRNANGYYKIEYPDDNNWHYLVFERQSGTVYGYMDGAHKTVTPGGSNYSQDGLDFTGSSFFIQRFYYGSTNYYKPGTIDEVRISTSARTGPWIATEYANQNSPGTFAVAGSPVSTKTRLNPGAWGRKCKITIPAGKVSGASNLTNFPVLLTEANLPNEMFDADGSYPAKNGGGDIRFSTTRGGHTEMCFEIVDFTTDNDPANGTAEIWVKVPSLSPTQDNVFYVWFNNPAASAYAIDDTYGAENVWSNGYRMVHHLEESDIDGGANDILDSTSYDSDGTTSGMNGDDDVPAKIGNGFEFDGDNDYIMLSSHIANFSGLNTGTIQGWIYHIEDAWQVLFWVADFDQKDDFSGVCSPVSNTLYWYVRDTAFSDVRNNSDILTPNDWSQVVVTCDASSTTLYVNGSVVSSSWGQGSEHGYFFNDVNILDVAYIGVVEGFSASTIAGYTNGKFDEVRVSSTARSADWITTEYANQNSPGTFAIEGTAAEDGVCPVLSIGAGTSFKVKGGTTFRIKG